MQETPRLAGVVFFWISRCAGNSESDKLTARRQPDGVNVFDVGHPRSLLKSDEKRLKRTLFALGYHLDFASAQVPADAGETQLFGAVEHEIAKTDPLNATLNDGVQAFRLRC